MVITVKGVQRGGSPHFVLELNLQRNNNPYHCSKLNKARKKNLQTKRQKYLIDGDKLFHKIAFFCEYLKRKKFKTVRIFNINGIYYVYIFEVNI